MFRSKTSSKGHRQSPCDNLSGFISDKSDSGVCDEFCSDSVDNRGRQMELVETEDVIDDDTQMFNQMMEKQYGEFEFSYYYVESKGGHHVGGGA